jgi:hypothetical protein
VLSTTTASHLAAAAAFCRVTNADKVVELAGNIDHGNVLSDPAAQEEIGKALQQLLAR